MLKPMLAPSLTDFSGGESASGGYSSEPNNSAPILLQYWATLRHWKYVVAAIILAALAIGFVTTVMTTPQFTSVAQIEIRREQKNVTNVEGVESDQSSQDQEFYQTEYTLLESRSLAERVARQLNLGSNQEFLEAHGLTEALGTTTDQRQLVELAASTLLKHVEIVPITRSRLVEIRYSSGSAQTSARIANAWAQQYIQASIDRRFASTEDARHFLEARLLELAGKVQESERTLVNFASANGIIALTTQRSADGKTTVERTLVSSDLETLNNALSLATAERIAAGAATIGSAGESATTNSAINNLRQRRAELAADYSRLLVQFEPGYPAARALNEQIQSLDRAIQGEVGRVNQSRQSSLAQAVRRESDLRAKVEQLKGQLDTQSRASIQYNIYQRDADTNRQLYDSLLQRYKEIGVSGVAANNIAIVDRAQVANSPSSPSIVKNLFVALVLGLGAALLTIFALEQIDESLREPGDVKRLLDLPLLGTIPDVTDEGPLESLLDPKSHMSEAYFSVRSNLAFATEHGLPKSVMVTSSKPGEGKSTTAYALATVLARTGRRTIVVDADMRSPSIHHLASQSNASGLSNYLTGENDWRSLVQSTSNGSLQVIAAGPTPPSAAELLSSDRMLQLVAALTEQYENVVVDAPPLLGLADSPMLSRSVEGVIFVVESSGVPVRGLRAALSRLQMAQAHIYGVVLTKLSQRNSGYGVGYGYGYGNENGKASS
jgi:succinoglycan biosynthesis transport protein ExoP